MRSAHLIQPSLPLAKLHNRHADRLYRLACLLDSLPQLPEQVLLDLFLRRVVGGVVPVPSWADLQAACQLWMNTH